MDQLTLFPTYTNLVNRMKNQQDLKKRKKTIYFLILTGLASTIWFFMRVIPKPSRVTYPCMWTVAPFMSAFIIYLLSLGTAILSIKKFKQNFAKAKYLSGSVFLLVAIISFFLYLFQDSKQSIARSIIELDETFPVPSNEPVGEAKGLFPGRVVWIYDQDATNENYDPASASNDWWYSHNNVDQDVVKKMLSTAIVQYAGKNEISEAWEAIFKSYNSSQGRGETGYTVGEKIAVKLTSSLP